MFESNIKTIYTKKKIALAAHQLVAFRFIFNDESFRFIVLIICYGVFLSGGEAVFSSFQAVGTPIHDGKLKTIFFL